MKLVFAVLTLFSMTSFADIAASECVAILGLNKASYISDSLIKGKAANNEISKVSSDLVRKKTDRFGRVLMIETQIAISSSQIEGGSDDTATASLIRYCSKSTNLNAQCVSICEQETSYMHP